MKHPYAAVPPHQRWRSAMTRVAAGEIDPVVASSWRISSADRIATAGSCFAQHVARRLRAAGLSFVDAEPAHPILSPTLAADFGYGLYSARFGSIYTSRQLLQLLRRAFGSFVPQDDVWEDDGRLFDPYRPVIQPGGYPTRQEFDLDREGHLAAVRRMFQTATVFVFTLGLTECWRSTLDGAVYPVCPGVSAGRFDAARHEFHNLGAFEIIDDLDAFLSELRAVNPTIRVILTVSPVPLAATAEPRHVWTSTTASKAALRVAAEEIARRPGVTYFPSYEVVTSPAARGAYYEDDLREVTAAGVDHVMRLFFKHMVEADALQAPPAPPDPADDFLVRSARLMDVICEEASLDPAD
jgi:GSCFA family